MTQHEQRAWDNEWAMYGSKIWQHIGMRRGDISSHIRSQILSHLSDGAIKVASHLINNSDKLHHVEVIRARYTSKGDTVPGVRLLVVPT